MLALVPARGLGDVPAPSFHYSQPYDTQVRYNENKRYAQTDGEVCRRRETAPGLIDKGWVVVAPLYTAVYDHCCIETFEWIRREATRQTGRSGARSDIKPIRRYMHRQQRYKLRVSELQTSVTSPESHTKLKEEGDSPTRVPNGTDPQYSGAA